MSSATASDLQQSRAADDCSYESMWLDPGTGEVIIGLAKRQGVVFEGLVPATADDMAAQMMRERLDWSIGQAWGEETSPLDDPFEDFVRRWDRSYGA